MAKTLGLIGVPTSMGAFAPGQEKGPAALRNTNLLGRLSSTGVEGRTTATARCGAGGRTRATAAHRTRPP